jgi:hypothetical protein
VVLDNYERTKGDFGNVTLRGYEEVAKREGLLDKIRKNILL